MNASLVLIMTDDGWKNTVNPMIDFLLTLFISISSGRCWGAGRCLSLGSGWGRTADGGWGRSLDGGWGRSLHGGWGCSVGMSEPLLRSRGLSVRNVLLVMMENSTLIQNPTGQILWSETVHSCNVQFNCSKTDPNRYKIAH